MGRRRPPPKARKQPKNQAEAIEQYVFDMMPDEVREARNAALHNLYYGAAEPDEDIGQTWADSSEIVNDWWDENMGDDLVVDDGLGVSTQYEFEKHATEYSKDRYKEALQEAIDEGLDDDEAEERAQSDAQAAYDSEIENSTLWDSSDVKRQILTRDWP